MDRFRLALALKCLRTPFLEKRLVGITDIKEIISASLRRQELLESADGDYAGATSNIQVPLCWCSPDFLLEWLEREQAHLPISPYISLYLPISPHISLYLPISPYISPYLPISPAWLGHRPPV